MSAKAERYRLSPLAEADLDGIWLYTYKTWSRAQADRYHNELVAAFRAIATNERRGRPVQIRSGYLRLPVGSHSVFYRLEDAEVIIVRILHQRMDPDRHL